MVGMKSKSFPDISSGWIYISRSAENTFAASKRGSGGDVGRPLERSRGRELPEMSSSRVFPTAVNVVDRNSRLVSTLRVPTCHHFAGFADIVSTVFKFNWTHREARYRWYPEINVDRRQRSFFSWHPIFPGRWKLGLCRNDRLLV